MSRSNEPFWWSLFSAGGVLAALFVPALIVVTGLLLPTAEAEAASARYGRLVAMLGWWPAKVPMIAVIGLCSFHCAHRIRHVLMDLGGQSQGPLLKVSCYGLAGLATLAAVVVVGRI